MNDLDRQLTDHLHATANLIEGPTTTPDGIRRRALRRRRRRSTVGAVAAVTILGGAGLFAISTDTTDAETVEAAGPEAATTESDSEAGTGADATDDATNDRDDATAPVTPFSTGPVGVWSAVDLPAGIEPWSVSATSNGFYASSPQGSSLGALHRSDDGRTWTTLPSSPSTNIWTIGASEELIAVVGLDDTVISDTEPSNTEVADGRGIPESAIWTSRDQGATWDFLTLPPSEAQPEPESPYLSDNVELSVIVRDDTLVATRSTWRGINEQAVLERVGVTNDDVESMSQTDDRFSIVTMSGERFSVTYDELGISEEVQGLFTGPSGVEILVSTNGAPATIVQRIDDGYGATPVTTPARFVVTVWSEDGEARWTSDDGITWDVGAPQAGIVPGTSGTSDAFTFRARDLIRTGPDGDSDPLLTLDPPLEVSGVAASGDVIVVTAMAWDIDPGVIDEQLAELPDATLTKDARTLVVSFAENRIAVIEDATGNVVFETSLDLMDENGEAPGVQESDDGAVTISDPTTGEIVFEFSEAEFSDANPDMFDIEADLESDAVATYGPSDSTTMIGVSMDNGATWGWQPAEDAFSSRAAWVNLISDGTTTMAFVDRPSGSGLFVLDGVGR